MTQEQHRTLAEEAVSGRHLRSVSFPDLENRAFWDALPSDYRRELISQGEEALTMDWPVLLLSDYMEFSRTGNRTHFEDRYFLRRRMLDALVLAEGVENKGRFLGKAVDGLWLILEETSWCLPAHNSYIRDTKQFPVPRDSAPVVDLFAAETGATVGLAEAILRPALQKLSPLISEYAGTELYRRIFRPYLSYHFWWMGDGHSKMLNWTPWITGNVLLAALTRPETGEDPEAPHVWTVPGAESRSAEGSGRIRPERERFSEMMPATGQALPEGLTTAERDRILSKAAVSLDYFLDEYENDGCCDEGAQYFSHAGLMLYTCLSLLAAGLDDPSGIRRLEQTPLIRNMASYIVSVHVSGPYYINYADCSPLAGARTAGEYCYGRDAGVPALVYLAAEDFRQQSKRERALPEEISLYQRLRQAACAGAMLREAESGCGRDGRGSAAAAPEDVFYPSTGLMVARDDRLVLACKAGDNGDSHNHNDVGSVILYKDGQPFLIDLGVETYTAKTFSADRYSIWTMQSQYHNLPTFVLPDGTWVQQKDGEAYAACSVQCSLAGDAASIGMDLAGAYPETVGGMDREKAAGGQETTAGQKVNCQNICLHYERKVSLHKGRGVVLEDRAELAPGVGMVLSLMTYEKPVRNSGSDADVSLPDGGTEDQAGSDAEHGRGDQITLEVGTLGKLILEDAADCMVEDIPITDARLGEMWRHDVYRILVRPTGKRLRVLIPE